MPTSSWEALVAHVVEVLQTIPDIGQVYDRQRLVFDSKEFLAVAAASIDGDTKARMWMVRLESMESSWADTSGAMQWNRKVVIDGFLQIEDAEASENTGVALAEEIIRTLAADWQSTRLGGLVLEAKPPVITINRPEFLVIVAVHHLALSMPVINLEL